MAKGKRAPRTRTVDPMTDMVAVATWKKRRNYARKMWRVHSNRELMRSDGPGSLRQWYGHGVRLGLIYLLEEAEEKLQHLGYETPDVEVYDPDLSDVFSDTDPTGEDKGDRDAKGGDRAGNGSAAATVV